MPTKQQLESALVNADKAGDFEAAKKIANALKQGNYSGVAAPVRHDFGDVPLLPEQVSQLSPAERQQYYGTSKPEVKDRGIGEKITGALEVGKTLASGATLGTMGAVDQTLVQTGREIASGEFGTPEAAQRIQEGFQRGMETGTSMPKTEAGQEYLEATGKVLEPLGALPPVMPFVNQAGKPTVFNYSKITPRQKAIRKELEENPRNPDFAKFEIVEGSPKKTARRKEAVKQFGGGREGQGTIAVIANASPTDKRATREMVEIVKKSRKDPLFADSNRVGDVVGNNLRNRVLRLNRINSDAGKAIDNIARNQLAGKTVDLTKVRDSFKSSMDDLRVKYNPETGEVDFSGSALEGSGGAATRDLITRIAPRLKSGQMDAADAHFIKRMIDKDVTFGKSPGGIAGEIDSSVKGLRKGINDAIRDVSEPYKKANIKYKESLEALENLQKASGTTIDLESPQALGVSLRRLTNNTVSRAKLLESLDEVDSVLKKNGITMKGDIRTQANIATALENRFKLQGKTSLEGIGNRVAGEVTKTKEQRGAEIIAAGVDKFAGIDDDKALDALLEIAK